MLFSFCHKGAVICVSEVIVIFLAILISVRASSSPALLMTHSAYKLNKQGDNILDILLSQFGTSLLLRVQFSMLFLDLHTNFSAGGSGGLVLPSFKEFSAVGSDPQSQRL